MSVAFYVRNQEYCASIPRRSPSSAPGGTLRECLSELLDALFSTAAALCSELGLTLTQTPVTWTLSGELQALIEFNQDEKIFEDAEMLLSFTHEGGRFYVVRSLDPVFIVGRQVEASVFEALWTIWSSELEGEDDETRSSVLWSTVLGRIL